MRAFLKNVTKRHIPVTYQAPARAFQILSPHSIHRVAEAGGLPAPGFFDCAPRVGRFAGDPDGQDAWSFHGAKLKAIFARWGGSRDNSRRGYHMFIETNPTPTRGSAL